MELRDNKASDFFFLDKETVIVSKENAIKLGCKDIRKPFPLLVSTPSGARAYIAIVNRKR